MKIKMNFFSLLFFQDASVEVGTALMKWVYTDKADIRTDESFIMDLVRVANRYQLNGLRNRYVFTNKNIGYKTFLQTSIKSEYYKSVNVF